MRMFIEPMSDPAPPAALAPTYQELEERLVLGRGYCEIHLKREFTSPTVDRYQDLFAIAETMDTEEYDSEF